MNADTAPHQRIGRLTPLADVLALIAQVPPVAARDTEVAQPTSSVLAHDVCAAAAVPAQPLALIDGWAVASELTRDAGPYAPVVIALQRVDAFQPMPPATDAVAPLDAVNAAGESMQLVAPVAPGEHVLPAGADVQSGQLLLHSGRRLRATDLAALSILAVRRLALRSPAIVLVNTRRGDPVLDAITDVIARDLRASGAEVTQAGALEPALRDDKADAVIGIGGTGAGRSDRSVLALKRAGRLGCHGVALTPGETAAFGTVGSRPVLLLPGRLDAALAVWLVLGRRLIASLSGSPVEEGSKPAVLSRKITSGVGVASWVPVHKEGDEVRPLGTGFLSLQTLLQADGWILVPAECEGYPAGTRVDVRPLP